MPRRPARNPDWLTVALLLAVVALLLCGLLALFPFQVGR